ncbi:MAG TPA: PstS family phosphate ABC transporter substrate-binding protein, partial [Thermomicrobiales bacterium]|nr:PstS family phosphate ABC transporter substrate-binding protein [Thermomicrobiales bacterium]
MRFWIDGSKQARRGALIIGLLAALVHPNLARGQMATPPAPAYVAPPELATQFGRVAIDGSSTVWPLTYKVGQQFRDLAPAIIVDTQISGTTGGFRRFCFGASDIQDASRPITDAEAAECAQNGVRYQRFEVGLDGITVVVHPDVAFVDCLTVAQLRALWQPGSTIRTWRELNPAWPDHPIALYGPGPDSGTFDYFTQAIVGSTDASRADYISSEDDDELVKGVVGHPFALGYFGYSYYEAHRDALKALAIDAGDGCVRPSIETITNGSYRPLSRPLYVYVSERSLARPEVREFMRFYADVAARTAAA